MMEEIFAEMVFFPRLEQMSLLDYLFLAQETENRNCKEPDVSRFGWHQRESQRVSNHTDALNLLKILKPGVRKSEG